MENAGAAEARPERLIQNFVVLFVDALGTSAKLRSLERIPSDPGEREDFAKRFQRMVSGVDATRGYFRTYFEEANPDSLVPELEINPREPLLHFFSDSLIAAVPLHDDRGHLLAQADAVLRVLHGACALQLMSLALHMPLRGGVELGPGVEIDSATQEVFGPCFQRAYELERLSAEYPRIVLGDRILEFLVNLTAIHEKDPVSAMTIKQSKDCLGLVVRGEDGFAMLDFMGTGMRKMGGTSIPTHIAAEALSFVTKELEGFRKPGDRRLWSRYYRLHTYMSSRMALWGEAPA